MGSSTLILSGLTSVLLAFGTQVAARQRPVITPEPDGAVHRLEQFAGVWIYNPDESVNAATGRLEQSPRSATQRAAAAARLGGAGANASGGDRAGGMGRGGGADANGLTGGGAGAGGFGNIATGANPSGGFTGGTVGPTFAMIEESRSLTRDLLEVPEALTIKVASNAVVFVDDLERARTYGAARQHYLLGAAQYSAAIEWKESQLYKRIDASDGFRMNEVYFLSPDGQRMFVIIRLGQQKKGAPIVGVNRVYDRVNP